MTRTLDSGVSLRRRAWTDLFAATLTAAAVALATWSLLPLPATFLAEVAVLWVAFGIGLRALLPRALPGPGLGPANRITLVRVIILLPLAGLLFHPEALGIVARWWIVILGTIAMVLDGFDGWIARRTGTETSFGARFDMETDAALMLVLSGLVWMEGRAGAWVLLIGAMRYLFVAAGVLLPALRAPLFPSLRRRVVCVVQGVALLVCLGPITPAPLATMVAAAALATLAWSFGIDTIWLLRRDHVSAGSGS